MFHRNSRSSRATSTIALGITAVASIALLTGCAGGSGTASSAPGATSSASSSSSGSTGSSVAVPSNFPHAVPLVKGEVVEASGDADNGWTATVDPSGKGGFAKAEAALVSAGFTRQPGGTKTQATFSNSAYTAILSTPGETVTYIISTR